jgi:hypothetical protein
MPGKFPQLEPKRPDKVRIEFNPDNLRRMIAQHGLDMKWESAARCPCTRKLTQSTISGDTFEPRTDCAGCDGEGILHFNSQPIRALGQSASQDPNLFTMYGEHAQGMLRITVLPEHIPGVLDRFTLMNSSFIWNEIRVRTSDPVDKLRYPAYRRLVDTGQCLDPTEVKIKAFSVIYCRKADANGELVAGELLQDTDFEVTDDGDIDWSIGDVLTTAPAVGEKYSMRYFARPVYIARNFPFTHRDQPLKKRRPEEVFTPLVTRVDCWLEHLGSRGLPFE